VVDNVAGLAAAPAGVVVTLEHDLAHRCHSCVR
jgi:hypothetical protein